MTARIIAADCVQTLDDFEKSALRVAGELRARGVGAGDRVMLKAGNSAAYVHVLFALMHVGASIVLVDQQERAEDSAAMARRAGVKTLIVDDEAPVEPGARPVGLLDLLVAAASRPTPAGGLSWETWESLPDGLVMWTSGSTGEPKGVVKSGGKFLRNLRRNAAQVGHRADDTLLPLLPFCHQYGLSMVLIAWLCRGSLVIAPYRRLDRALRMAGAAGATVFDATPAGYRSIAELIARRHGLRQGLSSARMLCSGAAPLDEALVRRYVRETGLPLLDSYGSTELGNVAFATPDNPVACGRAMEGIRLRVVGEAGAALPAGAVGEIEVDSPDALEGFLEADGLLVPAAGGWARTGDLGLLDADGNLTVLGRKFAVQRMGHTVYPEIVERKAARAGCSARVVALPDERWGARLVFFVEDEEGREAAYWRELLGAALPRYERPNEVVVFDRFPLNRNGKPDKRELERRARALAGQLDPR